MILNSASMIYNSAGAFLLQTFDHISPASIQNVLSITMDLFF